MSNAFGVKVRHTVSVKNWVDFRKVTEIMGGEEKPSLIFTNDNLNGEVKVAIDGDISSMI